MYIKNNKFTLTWAALIGVLSLMPRVEFTSTEITSIDTVVHVFFYLILTILLIAGNIRQQRFLQLQRSPVLWAFVIATAYGGIIELIQGTVFVSRSIDLYDFLANIAGAFLGYLGFLYLYGQPKKYMPWKRKNIASITNYLKEDHTSSS